MSKYVNYYLRLSNFFRVSFIVIILKLCRHQLLTSSVLLQTGLYRLTTSNQENTKRKVCFRLNLGLGKYVGYVLFVSYFTLLPKFFEAILPLLLDHLPRNYLRYVRQINHGAGSYFH